jgi:hypothetical protein
MSVWSFVPLPAVAALLCAAGAALTRKGPPAGRTAFALFAIAVALPMAFLVAVQWQPAIALARPLTVGASLSLAAFPALVLTLAFRLGREGGGLGRFGVPMVMLAAGTSLALLLAGAFGAGAAHIEILGERSSFEVRNLGARALLGELLLTGAAGVVLFQSLWESARRARKPRLRRAAAGLLLTSLAIFLVTGQTLLYGGAALHVLSLATLGALPAALAALPALLSRDVHDLTVFDRARCGISSGALMGLGAFLIALAVVGEIMEKIAPAGRLLWFHWGGTILVGGFATIWLVPGLRGRARRWFRVPVLPARYDWDWRNLPTRPGQRPAAAAVIAAVGDVFAPILGRATPALWIQSDDPPGFEPWSGLDSPLPFLRRDNPLPRLFRPWAPVVDLTTPPGSLVRVSAYVENLDLVEHQGFRLFVALSSGSDTFGVLAFVPRASRAAPSGALTLELSAGPLSAAVWGALLAASPEDSPVSGESWLQTAALLHRTAEEARSALPDGGVGERLATWASASAEVCTVRAGRAVGRVPVRPRTGSTETSTRTEARP